MKSLNDLVFPSPPGNAGQARGYVNQVLKAIGKLQETPGSEVYQWAQECLTTDENTLKLDPRFPRTEHDIASKLIKTCRANFPTNGGIRKVDIRCYAVWQGFA